MKTLESAMVTVRLHPKQHKLDMELPTFLPAKDLSEKVLETFRAMELIQFDVDRIIFSIAGKKLDEKDCLASLGIWDGSILDAYCVKNESIR